MHIKWAESGKFLGKRGDIANRPLTRSFLSNVEGIFLSKLKIFIVSFLKQVFLSKSLQEEKGRIKLSLSLFGLIDAS